MIDFPASPTVGQQFTTAGVTWQWDGVKWIAVGGGSIPDAPNDGTLYGRKSAAWAYLTHTDITDWTATLAPYALTTAVPVASSTLPLADGVAAIGTSTAYARADHVHPIDGYSHDNRIINGDMRIDQRNNGASGTATGYTVDRWQYSSSQAGKFNWGRNFGPPGGFAPGFPYCLGASSTSAYALLAADFFVFQQTIEADMVSDFAWGGAGAQPVTLSFWALAYPLTGTFGGALRNAALTRSYPFTFSLPTTNTWTKIVITIPGDTTGAWVMSGNAASMSLIFDLGSGANNRAPAGAWAAGNYLGANGAVSVVATNGASFYVTGVKLEIGSVATPFNRQSLAKSMADCQRYYSQVFSSLQMTTAGATAFSAQVSFPVQMRATPTVVMTASVMSRNNVNPSYPQMALQGQNGMYVSVLAAAAGDTYDLGRVWTASAEL